MKMLTLSLRGAGPDLFQGEPLLLFIQSAEGGEAGKDAKKLIYCTVELALASPQAVKRHSRSLSRHVHLPTGFL